MTRSLLLLGSLPLSLLLTGCPLSDHYQLVADGGAAAGANAEGGSGGSSGVFATFGGSAGAVGMAGSPGASGASDGGTSTDSGGGGTGNVAGSSGSAAASGSGVSGDGSGGLASSGAVSGWEAANAGQAGRSGASGEPGTGLSGASGTAGIGDPGAGRAGSGGSSVACFAGCGSGACCASSCVDLSTDPKHCGACGKACSAGRSCTASACTRGWASVKTPPVGVAARSRAASVAMAGSVFFWGGLDSLGNALDNGAIYSPKTDSWIVLPKDTGSPSARIMASAVWTGSVVIVYGGSDAAGTTLYRDGAVYDPVGNSWTPLPTNGNLRSRSAPFGYWDGTRAVFWGGLNAMGLGVAGADRFDLSSWSASSLSGDPGALAYPSVVFDGPVMYLIGGLIGGNRQDKVFAYTSTSNTWSSLPQSLSVRSAAFGAWDGTRLVVWGGRDDNGLRNEGKSLLGATWSALATNGAPSARAIAFRRSGWCFQAKPGVVVIMGGQTSVVGSGTLATGGFSYDVLAAQWTTVPDWPSGEMHEYGMGTWTGEEFVLWGGRDANVPTTTGERWSP